MPKTSQYMSSWLLILAFALAFAALGLPSFTMVIGDVHFNPILSAFIFGLGIVGGAFLIPWAAEAGQVYVSALIVGIYLYKWKFGSGFSS